jgi:vacuolar-type H+-ATPase subunit H
MDELEYIKKVEEEVADQVEKARSKAEKKINDSKPLREKMIMEKTAEANMQMDKQAKKVTEDAQKEVENIRKSTDGVVGKIEEEAGRNLEAGVEIILKEFRSIH